MNNFEKLGRVDKYAPRTTALRSKGIFEKLGRLCAFING